VDLMSASRGYEANVAAISTVKDMNRPVSRPLQIALHITNLMTISLQNLASPQLASPAASERVARRRHSRSHQFRHWQCGECRSQAQSAASTCWSMAMRCPYGRARVTERGTFA